MKRANDPHANSKAIRKLETISQTCEICQTRRPTGLFPSICSTWKHSLQENYTYVCNQCGIRNNPRHCIYGYFIRRGDICSRRIFTRSMEWLRQNPGESIHRTFSSNPCWLRATISFNGKCCWTCVGSDLKILELKVKTLLVYVNAIMRTFDRYTERFVRSIGTGSWVCIDIYRRRNGPHYRKKRTKYTLTCHWSFTEDSHWNSQSSCWKRSSEGHECCEIRNSESHVMAKFSNRFTNTCS